MVLGTAPLSFRQNPHSIGTIHRLNQSELLNTAWQSNDEEYVRLHPTHNFMVPQSWNSTRINEQNTSTINHCDYRRLEIPPESQSGVPLEGKNQRLPVMQDIEKVEPAQPAWDEFDIESEMYEFDSYADFDVDPTLKAFFPKATREAIWPKKRDQIQYRLVRSPSRQRQPNFLLEIAPPFLCCMFILAALVLWSIVQRHS